MNRPTTKRIGPVTVTEQWPSGVARASTRPNPYDAPAGNPIAALERQINAARSGGGMIYFDPQLGRYVATGGRAREVMVDVSIGGGPVEQRNVFEIRLGPDRRGQR